MATSNQRTPAPTESGAQRGFYVHLTVFAVVLALLGLLNLWLGPPYWVLWVLLGWGLGIILHAVLAATGSK